MRYDPIIIFDMLLRVSHSAILPSFVASAPGLSGRMRAMTVAMGVLVAIALLAMSLLRPRWLATACIVAVAAVGVLIIFLWTRQ